VGGHEQSGFKSAADTQNLINQVEDCFANRLEPVLYNSRGIDPARQTPQTHFVTP
jgi:hypothetical protein